MSLTVNESKINDTIDARASAVGDGNNYTESISFTTSAQTETLNLKRVGMLNLTAFFTDTDTTIGNCSTDQSCTNVLYDTNASDFMGALTDNWLDDDGDTGTGNYTFGSTALHIDDTNDRIGIGTATPEDFIDIENTGGNAGIKVSSNNNGNTTLRLLEGAGATSEYFGGWMMYYGGTGNTFQIGTINNSVPFPLIYIPRATTTVGINTSSPTQALDVKGNINSSGLCLYGDNCITGWAEVNSSGSSDGNNYTEAISFSGTGTITLNLDRVGLANLTAQFTDTDTTYTNSTGLALSGTTFSVLDNYLLNTGDSATGNYTFGADNVMHIDDTNNYVGIGTATPSTLFDIQSNSIANQLRVSYDDSNYANFSLGSDGNLTIKATNHVIIDLS